MGKRPKKTSTFPNDEQRKAAEEKIAKEDAVKEQAEADAAKEQAAKAKAEAEAAEAEAKAAAERAAKEQAEADEAKVKAWEQSKAEAEAKAKAAEEERAAKDRAAAEAATEVVGKLRLKDDLQQLPPIAVRALWAAGMAVGHDGSEVEIGWVMNENDDYRSPALCAYEYLEKNGLTRNISIAEIQTQLRLEGHKLANADDAVNDVAWSVFIHTCLQWLNLLENSKEEADEDNRPTLPWKQDGYKFDNTQPLAGGGVTELAD